MNKEVLKTISVLYVEDENDVREFTSKLLTSLLRKVYVAQDGQEGLKIFEENKDDIDLIISDINMPKMDGLSMCEAIKKINHEIPLVITSAHNDTNFLRRSIEIGVTTYAMKPIDLYQLMESIIKAMEPIILRKKLIELNLSLESKIEQEINKIKSILDAQDNIIIVTNKEEITNVNKKFLDFFGVDNFDEFIKSRKNILVVGGTASGKTTFCNGLLNAVAEIDPECRMIIIEDIRELQANIVDKVCMLVPPVTIKERKNGIGITAEMLLRSAMRRTPDRVVVGEIRDGDAAAVLLSAWNSGHSGGLTTIHADDIQGGLKKLEQYIEMSGKKPNPKLIAKTVHCIVSIQKTTVVAEDGRIYRKRMIEDIKMVDGYIEETGEYNLGYL